MEVGILEVDISLGGVTSLKEKRKIIKSVITRMRNKFNLSVSEIDYQDKWQKAAIAAVIVGNDKKYLDRILQKTVDMLDNEGELVIIDYQLYFW